MIIKFNNYINEDADFLKYKEKSLDNESKDAISFMVEDEYSELHIFNDIHVNYYSNVIGDWYIAKEIVIDENPFNLDKYEDEYEYNEYINDETRKLIEDELFEYIRGRLWVDSKVIGFWEIPETEFLMSIIKDLNDELDITIDGDWLLNLGFVLDKYGKETYKYIKLSEYTENKVSPEMRENTRLKEILHLMKSKDKKKELKKRGYKPKHKSNNMIDAEYIDKSTKYKFTESFKTFVNENTVLDDFDIPIKDREQILKTFNNFWYNVNNKNNKNMDSLLYNIISYGLVYNDKLDEKEYSTVLLLIKYNIGIDYINSNGINTITETITQINNKRNIVYTDIFKKLVDVGTNLNFTTPRKKETILHLCVRYNLYNSLYYTINKRELDWNIKNIDNLTFIDIMKNKKLFKHIEQLKNDYPQQYKKYEKKLLKSKYKI